MFVSRKEFDKLKEDYDRLNEVCIESWDKLDNRIDTLTKQIKCSCGNYKVQPHEIMVTICRNIYSGEKLQLPQWDSVTYKKVCLDCGWTTTYDTEEEALADKQELLDKQIDALKEQKKALKK